MRVPTSWKTTRSGSPLIKEIHALILERLTAARDAPGGVCRDCAVEELEEVLSIIQEVAYIYDEEIR